MFDPQILGGDVVAKVAMKGARVLHVGKVIEVSVVDDEVAQDRPEGVAESSGAVCQIHLIVARERLRLKGICEYPINHHVCGLEIDQCVGQDIELDQGGQVVSSQVDAEVFPSIECSKVAEINAAHVVLKDFRLLVLEIGWLGVVFVPCIRPCCSEELGSRDEDGVVDRVALLKCVLTN